jgi:hypothetical protein
MVDADELTVTVDAEEGTLEVQVLAENGVAIDGFRFADGEPVTGDELDIPVRRKRPADQLRDRPLRLEIRLKNARLFAVGLSTRPG